jgi:hypothetical protein
MKGSTGRDRAVNAPPVRRRILMGATRVGTARERGRNQNNKEQRPTPPAEQPMWIVHHFDMKFSTVFADGLSVHHFLDIG